MTEAPTYVLQPIGMFHSSLTDRSEAPRQGFEGGRDAWLEVRDEFGAALEPLAQGSEIIVVTWLHLARRDRLRVHPRGDQNAPLTGVFATRSPDRPNPVGLHRVRILEIDGMRLRVGPIEAVNGTPVVDIKPVLPESQDA